MIIGDSVRLFVKFKDEDNNFFDPDTVTIKYQQVGGQLQTFTHPAGEVVKDSTGQYHCIVALDKAGPWIYRWEGTGSQPAASEGMFNVEASNF